MAWAPAQGRELAPGLRPAVIPHSSTTRPATPSFPSATLCSGRPQCPQSSSAATRLPAFADPRSAPCVASTSYARSAELTLPRQQHRQPRPSLDLGDSPLQAAGRPLLEPLYLPVELQERTSLPSSNGKGSNGKGPGGKGPDFYANLGSAIRVIREDYPALFQKDLNYEIYREDIVFRDPKNTFKGLKNYQTICWSLRFHGSLFFRDLRCEVQRLWQLEETVLRMRWAVVGYPRVPWEAVGIFDGVSEFRLDSSGKIYEHVVDNVILRDPPRFLTQSPLLVGLNLLNGPSRQPVPCPALSWPQDDLLHMQTADALTSDSIQTTL